MQLSAEEVPDQLSFQAKRSRKIIDIITFIYKVRTSYLQVTMRSMLEGAG